MKRIKILSVIIASLLFMSPSVFAGGGSIGGFPGTGYKGFFAKGGASGYLPIRIEGETYIGSSDQHGIGGSLGFDVGLGLAPSLFIISPEYKYYFNGGKESSPLVGAYIDFGFGSKSNRVGLGALGGYQYFFNESIGIYGAGILGMGSVGTKNFGFSARRTGAEFGFRAGVKFVIK